MQDIIEMPRYVNELGNIMMIKLKFLQFEEVLYITQVTGNEVIHPDNMVSFLNKAVAQMRPEKTGRTRNQYSFCCHNAGV